MAKISIAAAEKAAEQIVAPLKVKSENAQKLVHDFLIKTHLYSLPKEVVDLFNKYPKYLDKSSSCKVFGIGINGDYHGLPISIPSEHGWSPTINLNQREAKEYLKMNDEYEAARKKYLDTEKEITNTLLTLGTHKKIAEIMPNALRFLPEINKPSRELVLQIQPIVDKVNCLITNEDKCVDKL